MNAVVHNTHGTGQRIMLFRKRKSISPAARSDSEVPAEHLQGRRVEFDMMLKGNIYERPSGPVRQYGVTVQGSTRLVTSGEWVDRETYEALVEAGAVRPDPASLKRIAERKKRIVTDPDADTPDPPLNPPAPIVSE